MFCRKWVIHISKGHFLVKGAILIGAIFYLLVFNIFLYSNLDRTVDPYVGEQPSNSILPSTNSIIGQVEIAKHKFYTWWSGMRRIKKKEGFQNFNLKVSSH